MTYDGIKWIASMYDMDSTWGLDWNGETVVKSNYPRTSYEDMTNNRQGNLLYERLENMFYNELIARWNELKSGALSISNTLLRFEKFINIAPTSLVQEDYSSTTGGGLFTGIPSKTKNNLQQIRTFIVERYAWTDDYLNSLIPVDRIPCTGIELSENTITFTEVGTYTLTVIVTPENTNDKVVWQSSDENVVTVQDGKVISVGNGTAIITVTCGDQIATCNVSVSGINAPEDNETLLYSLPMTTTFDGTNYIDTGVTPLAEDKPFTVVIDWTHTGESEFVGSKYVIAHCMTEIAPYSGLILQYGTQGIISELRQGSSISSNSVGADISNADLQRVKVVYTKAADGTLKIARCYNNNGIIHKNTKASTFIAVPETLILGCYQTTVGTKGRYAKGILNDCRVYNYAFDDSQIEEALLY